MTVKGGTSQACAACKYQRRKCSVECPLAPYFPPDQPKVFQNAHRLFGVSNILKILKPLSEGQKIDAMRSIIYQSNIRDKYRVHGCCAIIKQLQLEIHQTCLELEAVNTQLALCRQQYHNQLPSPPPPPHSPNSQLQLGTGGQTNALPFIQNHPYQPFNGMEIGNSPGNHLSFSNGNNAAYGTVDYMDNNNNKDNIMNPLWVQHPYISNNITNNNNPMAIHITNNNNPMAIQTQLMAAQAIPLQQLADAPQDYDEMPTFFDTIDDRQSYIDSKDPYESSSESSLKDTKESIEHIAENELKNAAACLSLTSVN